MKNRFKIVYADTFIEVARVDSLSDAENELKAIEHSDELSGVDEIDYAVEDMETGDTYEYINGHGLWMTPIEY